jgi:hypothetical protein
MKLARLVHEPSALLEFFQQALEHCGALTDRSWHDRLQVVAQGPAARLWNPDGALHEAELYFTEPDASTPRQADREVFPGSPLTLRLAELLRPHPLAVERVVLAAAERAAAPAADVAEKLWRAQRPGVSRWRLETPFAAAHHFSLLALARCEIQAIDQHWSLHRLVLSLPKGQRDESLAAALDLAELAPPSASGPAWPALVPTRWGPLLSAALAEELESELGSIRTRQENYLRRELDRVDDYFESYAQELQTRAARTSSETTRMRTAERLAAAKAEHARRREDQLRRHEIRVIPHLDAWLLLAEPAWQATVTSTRGHETATETALFVPRSRRWHEVHPA